MGQLYTPRSEMACHSGTTQCTVDLKKLQAWPGFQFRSAEQSVSKLLVTTLQD